MGGFLTGVDPGIRKTKTPTVNTFTHGAGFTAGSSTTISLTDDPGTEEHLTIFFDGVGQHRSTYSVSGSTVTFDTAIPTGVAEVEATYAPAVYAQLSTVGTNAVTETKIADGAVTAAKLDGGAAASTTDMRLAFLMIAENAGDRLNMDDGIADPFKDETDVDTSTSTNETYNAAGDYYTSQSVSKISTSGLTPIGDFTSGGGLAAAFNGTQHENSAVSATRSGDTGGPVYLGMDWGSGVTKTVTEIRMYGATNTTFHNTGSSHDIFFDLIGHTSDAPGSATDLGIGAAVDNASATSMTATTAATNTSTAYRYHWVDCHSSTTNATWTLSELEFYEANTVNMTLVSNAFTATAVPATGRIHIQVNPVDSITINTDLTAEISRDGGTTWTTATLVLKETLKDGTVAYEANSVTISGQPSGTSMKYRIKTLNTKEVQVHGVVLQWSA